MTVEERFWSRVQKTPTCWLWTGAKFSTGYGVIAIDRKSTGAHRVAYELLVGPIPKGMHLDHLCRVRHCVNPNHLEPVTIKTNLMRGKTKAAANAAKTHCPQGHPYDEVNTYVSKTGSRMCRECLRIRNRAFLRKRREGMVRKKQPSAAPTFGCGHAKEGNSYTRKDGGFRCKICHQYAAAVQRLA